MNPAKRASVMTLAIATILFANGLAVFAQSVPELLSVQPSIGVTGTTVTVVLTGRNFSAITKVIATGSATVTSVTAVNSSSMLATLLLAGSPGVSNLRVTNGSATSQTLPFSVGRNAVANWDQLTITPFA